MYCVTRNAEPWRYAGTTLTTDPGGVDEEEGNRVAGQNLSVVVVVAAGSMNLRRTVGTMGLKGQMIPGMDHAARPSDRRSVLIL